MAYTVYKCEYEGCDFISYNRRAYEEHLKEHKKKEKKEEEKKSEKKSEKKKKKKELLDTVISGGWRGRRVTVQLMNGTTFTGEITLVTKYEIALRTEKNADVVIFKHAISHVYPLEEGVIDSILENLGLKKEGSDEASET